MKLASRVEELPPYLFVEISRKIAAKKQAGADVIVVGNSIEKNPNLIEEIAQSIHQYNTMKNNEVLSRN